MYCELLFAVMVSEPIVMAGGNVVGMAIVGVRANVLDPITTSLAPAARLILVPLTVIMPAGVSV